MKRKKSNFMMIALFSGAGFTIFMFVLVASMATSIFNLINSAVESFILMYIKPGASDLILNLYIFGFWVSIALIITIVCGLFGHGVNVWRRVKNQFR